MKPRVNVLTLATDDIERAVAFYRDGLGWATEGITGGTDLWDPVVFFDCANGMKIAFWSRRGIARDAGVAEGPASGTEFTLGYNVNTPAEVDATIADAARAGARIVKAPESTFWGGYAGCFLDPDGHIWDVVWNPYLRVEE